MADSDRAPIQLAPNTLKLADFASNRHDAIIPIGVTPEDLEQPEFWSHNLQMVRAWDEIRARSEDGTWMAVYLVLDRDRTWARVKRLHLYDLSPVPEAASSDDQIQVLIDAHEVKWRGPLGYSVVRQADGDVLHEKAGSEAAAKAWLVQWAQRQVAGAAARPEADAA